MRRHASLAMAAIIGMTLILTACGGGSSSGGVVNLTFWSFNQQITEQADAFNKTHPNIHVTALKQASGFGQYYPKVLAGVKAGNAPDVALIEYQYVPEFVSKGALVDLTQYGANDVKSQFEPAAWNTEVLNGGFYGYPQDVGPEGLFYNKKVFTQAGITTPPATWDEFAADAVKIHALGPNYYITAFSPTNTGWFQALMWQAGAIWFTTQGDSWIVNIDSAKSHQVAKYWDDLIKKGLVDTASTDGDFQAGWATALNSGTISAWPSAVWGQGVIPGNAADQKGNWAVSELPQWTAGAHDSAYWGGSGVSVIAGTKHPKEANEFAQWYLTNEDSLKIGVSEIGWFPSNSKALQGASTTANDYYGGQVINQIFVTAGKNINADWKFPPNLDTVTSIQGNAFNAALSSGQTLESQLAFIQAAIIQDLQGLGINAKAGS